MAVACFDVTAKYFLCTDLLQNKPILKAPETFMRENCARLDIDEKSVMDWFRIGKIDFEVEEVE